MTKALLPVLALNREDGDMWVDMFRDIWTHLLAALDPHYELRYITSQQEAKQVLSSGSVTAALALDAASASAVKASGFLQNGGTIVFCGSMPSNTRPSDIPVCFSQCGLPWDTHEYYRADFFPGAAAGELGLSLHSYNAKALVLGKVPPTHIVFGPTEQSYTQSFVFPSRSVGEPSAAAVAFGAAHGGYVGYVGDVNAEEASTSVILAMLQKATTHAT